MAGNDGTNFRRTHTKGFLDMMHPKFNFSEDTLTRMRTNSPETPIHHSRYEEKLKEYHLISGASLHHILIPTQTNCVICGSVLNPEPSKMKTVTVYVSLN